MKIELKTPYFTKEYEIPEEKLGGGAKAYGRICFR